MRGTHSHSVDSLPIQALSPRCGIRFPSHITLHSSRSSGGDRIPIVWGRRLPIETTKSFISNILTHLSALTKKGEHKKYFETRFRPPKRSRMCVMDPILSARDLECGTFQGSPEPLLYPHALPYPMGTWGEPWSPTSMMRTVTCVASTIPRRSPHMQHALAL